MNTALPIRNTKNKNGRQRMDLLSKWNQRIREEALPLSQGTGVAEMVKDLLQYNLKVWWSCGRSLPAFKVTYLPGEQAQKEKQLEKLANGLITELKHIPPEAGQRKAWQERLRPGMIDFARSALNLEQRHLDFIESQRYDGGQPGICAHGRRFDPAHLRRGYLPGRAQRDDDEFHPAAAGPAGRGDPIRLCLQHALPLHRQLPG